MKYEEFMKKIDGLYKKLGEIDKSENIWKEKEDAIDGDCKELYSDIACELGACLLNEEESFRGDKLNKLVTLLNLAQSVIDYRSYQYNLRGREERFRKFEEEIEEAKKDQSEKRWWQFWRKIENE